MIQNAISTESYLPDGTRLERKKQTWLNAGTTIIIGNEENVFKLGKSK